MKVVLNKCYGGFSLSASCAEKLGTDKYPWDDNIRFDASLIEEVEKDSEAASGLLSSLCVVTIPDEATDYEISEYDGWETVIYVLDGKLHRI